MQSDGHWSAAFAFGATREGCMEGNAAVRA